MVSGNVLQQYHLHQQLQQKSGAPGKLSLQAAKLAVNSPYLSPVSPNDVGAVFHEPTSLSTKSPTMMLIPSPLGSATNSTSSSSTSSPAVPFSSSVISNTPSTPSSLLLHTPPILSMSTSEKGRADVVSDTYEKVGGVGFREGVIKRLDSPSTTDGTNNDGWSKAVTTSYSSSVPHSSAPDYTVISPHKLALRKHMEEEEEKQRLLSTPSQRQIKVEVGNRNRPSPGEEAVGKDAWITASSNQRRIRNPPIEKKTEAHHLPAKLVHKMTNHSAQQKISPTTIASSCVVDREPGPGIAQSHKNVTLGAQVEKIIEAEYGLVNGYPQQHQSKPQHTIQPPKKTRRCSGKSPSLSSSGHAESRGNLSLNYSSQDHRGLGVTWTTPTKVAVSVASSQPFPTATEGSQRYSPEGVGLKLHIPYQFKTDPCVVNGALIDADDGGVSSSCFSNPVVTTTMPASFFSPISTRHESKPPSSLTATLFAAPKTDFSQLPTLPSGYLSLSSPTSSVITSSPALSLSTAHLVSSSASLSTPRSQNNHILTVGRPSYHPNSSTSHAPSSHSLTSNSLPAQNSLFHPTTTIIPFRKLHVHTSASLSSSHASTSPYTSHSRFVNGTSTPSPPCTSYKRLIPPHTSISLASTLSSQLRSVSTNIPSMSSINGTVRSKNSQVAVVNGLKSAGIRKSPVTTPP